MHKKILLMAFECFLALMIIPLATQAAIITSCILNRDTYQQGQVGYVMVTIYNDKDNKIRITELTATINYYYTDGTAYLQKFFTNASLPAEIQPGQSSMFHIPFSLPTNIAPGYTNLAVEAKTELWRAQEYKWTTSDRPTYQPKLYIESPYKQQYQEQLDINRNITNIMYFLATTTMLFAAALGFLIFLYRKTRAITQP